MSDTVTVAAITAAAGAAGAAIGSLTTVLVNHLTANAQANRDEVTYRRQSLAGKRDMLAALYTEACDLLIQTAQLPETYFIDLRDSKDKGDELVALRLSQIPLLVAHIAALNAILSRLRLSPHYESVRIAVEEEFRRHGEVTALFTQWKREKGYMAYDAKLSFERQRRPIAKDLVVPGDLHASIAALSAVLQRNLEDLEP